MGRQGTTGVGSWQRKNLDRWHALAQLLNGQKGSTRPPTERVEHYSVSRRAVLMLLIYALIAILAASYMCV